MAIVGGVLLICCIVWIALRSTHAPVVPPLVPAAPVVGAVPASSVDPPRAPAHPAPPPGHLAVCGAGHLTAAEVEDPLQDPATRERLAGARANLVAALMARGDDVSRAVGLLIAAEGGPPVRDEEVACERDDCPRPPQRVESQAARQRRYAGTVPLRDELVRLALATTSAEAYRIALMSCRKGVAEVDVPSCGMLSVAQWSRLDPGLAAPWLAVAGSAAVRRDEAGVADALHRFGSATRYPPSWGVIARVALDAMPATVSPWDAHLLTGDLFLADPLDPGFDGMSAVNSACSVAAVRDSNRAQTCDAVASMLVDRGTSLLDLAIGVAIGKRLGWPADRIAALELERSAARDQAGPRAAALMARVDCDGLHAHAEYLRDIAGSGERTAMRRLASAPDGPATR